MTFRYPYIPTRLTRNLTANDKKIILRSLVAWGMVSDERRETSHQEYIARTFPAYANGVRPIGCPFANWREQIMDTNK